MKLRVLENMMKEIKALITVSCMQRNILHDSYLTRPREELLSPLLLGAGRVVADGDHYRGGSPASVGLKADSMHHTIIQGTIQWLVGGATPAH